jgi:RNA polymerase sigma factor (sigma-70 family)
LGRHHKIEEEELVRLLTQQDRKAIEILYDNYSTALYGVIHRIVQSDEIAEDLLQETFVKIWKSFSMYNASKGRLFTWIMNIARNLAIDKVRSKDFVNSSKNQSLDNIVSFVEMQNNHAPNPDTIGVKELLEKLTPEQRSIIDLLYFKGYTQTEVAEKLNMPLGTVKTRTRLAINTLRKEFDAINIKE